MNSRLSLKQSCCLREVNIFLVHSRQKPWEEDLGQATRQLLTSTLKVVHNLSFWNVTAPFVPYPNKAIFCSVLMKARITLSFKCCVHCVNWLLEFYYLRPITWTKCSHRQRTAAGNFRHAINQFATVLHSIWLQLHLVCREQAKSWVQICELLVDFVCRVCQDCVCVTSRRHMHATSWLWRAFVSASLRKNLLHVFNLISCLVKSPKRLFCYIQEKKIWCNKF